MHGTLGRHHAGLLLTACISPATILVTLVTPAAAAAAAAAAWCTGGTAHGRVGQSADRGGMLMPAHDVVMVEPLALGSSPIPQTHTQTQV